LTGSVAGGITASFGVPALPLKAITFCGSVSAPKNTKANIPTALGCNFVGMIGLNLRGAYNATRGFQTTFAGSALIFELYMSR